VRIQYWDSDSLENVESERDYEGNTYYLDEYREYERGAFRSEVYIDSRNGLVVSDIAKYEAWLKTL
jgi:hypothetical protein